jgi:hypothetical protein
MGTGAVVVLDSGQGTVRRTIAVGVGPQSISIDTQRRRALVVDTGLNPDGTLAHVRSPASPWIQRLPLLSVFLSLPGQAKMPPDGRGSLTVLDLSRL